MPTAPFTTDFSSPPGVASSSAAPAAPAADELGLQGLQRRLLQAVCEHRDLNAMLDAVANVIHPSVRPSAVFYFCHDDAQRLVLGRCWLSGESTATREQWQQLVQGSCAAACGSGQMQVGRGVRPSEFVVSVPVFAKGRPPEAMGAVLSHAKTFDCDAATLQLAATHVSLWHVLTDRSGNSATSAAPLDLTGRLVESQSTRQAAQVLADELQRLTGCDRVAVLLRRGRLGSLALEALSGVRRFDRRSELVRLVEAAGRYAMLRPDLTVWPAASHADERTDPPLDEPAARSLEKLAGAAGAECVVSLPLRDGEENLEGACILWGAPQGLANSHCKDLLQGIQTSTANCLGLVARARSGVRRLVWRSLAETVSRWNKSLVIATVLVAVALLALPLPHKIACDCRIRPVTRRFVAAPHDGILERALVESGEVVSQGQILARMDGREIRWELASLYADRAAAMKKRDVAMASHDAGKVQFAKLDVERLDLKIQVLEHRAENLELKAPIDGIVIRGDLDKAEGAPLTVGQTLFEIAPLDKMVVELEVPEADIAYVREKLNTTFRLDAYPGRSWRGPVDKIQPRTEQRDQNEVFVAEFSQDNPQQLWKPGMSGRAKITSSLKPLGWILFHRAWERAAMKLGW